LNLDCCSSFIAANPKSKGSYEKTNPTSLILLPSYLSLLASIHSNSIS